MKSLPDLKRRINSVKKTKKITQALNMVATAKFKKSQAATAAARPYQSELHTMLTDIFCRNNLDLQHPLLNKREKGDVLVLVISSDRGLCGSFNSSLFKKVNEYVSENKKSNMNFVVVGTKAVRYFKKRDFEILSEYESFYDDFDYSKTVSLSDHIIDTFINGNYQKVVFIANQFRTALSQDIKSEQLLPLKVKEDACEEIKNIYHFEPGVDRFFSKLLKHYMHYVVYKILIESYTSEQGLRMTAMDAATENAKEMIDSLTLSFNRARQAAITAELAEIVAGAVN